MGSFVRHFTSEPLFLGVRTHFSPELCGTNCQREQVPHPDQVIGGGREGENPSNTEDTTMSRLAQQGHRFDPAKHFLDALPFAHADLIAVMARRAAVNGAAARALLIL